MQSRLESAGLADIAAKLDARSGVTPARRRPALPRRPTSPVRRLARQPRAREAPRRAHLLQLQHPARGDQRLRRHLPVLLVLRASKPGDARGATRCRSSRPGTSCAQRSRPAAHRSARRQRAASRTCRSATTRTLLRGFKRIRPWIHLQVLHRRRDRVLRRLYDDDRRAGAARSCKEAGLDSLPGGGAEIFAERVRRKICHDKADADRYLAIHRVAHRLGMRTERDDALRAHRDD